MFALVCLNDLGLTLMICQPFVRFLCWILFICILPKLTRLIENRRSTRRKIAEGEIIWFLEEGGIKQREKRCCVIAERMWGGTKLQIQQCGIFKSKHKTENPLY